MLKDKIGIISCIVLFIITGILAYFTLPFVALFFTIGSTLLLVNIYIKLYAKLKEEPLSGLNITAYTLSAVPLVLALPGFFMKIMHMPGAGVFLIISYVSIIAGSVL